MKLDKRTKAVLAVLVVLALLVGAEVALNLFRPASACVEVANLGAEPAEDVTLTFGTSRVVLGRLPAGETGRAFISGNGEQTVQLSFKQRGNALTSFQVPGFNPKQMDAEGFKLVLRLRPNEVERYQDEGEPSGFWARMRKAVSTAIEDTLHPG